MSVIFAGNGINQNEGLVYSWEELLDRAVDPSLPEKTSVEAVQMDVRKKMERPKAEGISMTMWFEFLEFFTVDNGIVKNGYELKKRIAKTIQSGIRRRVEEKDFSQNSTVHAQIMRLPANAYLTTNYDYTLEQSVSPDFKRRPSTKELEYSRMRYQTVEIDELEKMVYHIHGELQAPNSICLGFEHYSGSLEKMRSDLLRGTHD